MTYEEVLNQLESLGTAQNRKIYSRHGCDIEQFGVSTANLKKVLKSIKKDEELGYKLFSSQNADAITLSQWIVNIQKLTIDEIEAKILCSNYYMLIEYVIPHIVAKDFEKSLHCIDKWLHHKEPRFRQAGYSLYGIVLSVYPDDMLDMNHIQNELDWIKDTIHTEENRVRYTMNQFVIAVGAYTRELSPYAEQVAKVIGTVHVSMGETSCKVPLAETYISKIKHMNRIGKKRIL